MRLGPFYIDTKELFLLLAVILLGAARYFKWSLYWFDVDKLIILTFIFFITKALMHTIAHERFFFLALVCVFASLYLPLTQVIVLYGVLFFTARLLKFI